MRAARNATRKWSGTAIVLTTLLVTFLVLGAVVFFCLKQGRIRRWTAQQLWEAPATMSASPFDLRVILLDNRDRALDAGDLPAAARYNAKLAQEALRRARAVHDAWLVRREPKTKLYAERYYGGEWNYRNTAADFFGFHLHAALRLNPQAMPSLQETLAAELLLRTTDGLCQPVMAATGKPVSVDQDELLFASSEYCKDGLLSIYERYGGDLVGPRMRAIVDAIMRSGFPDGVTASPPKPWPWIIDSDPAA